MPPNHKYVPLDLNIKVDGPEKTVCFNYWLAKRSGITATVKMEDGNYKLVSFFFAYLKS